MSANYPKLLTAAALIAVTGLASCGNNQLADPMPASSISDNARLMDKKTYIVTLSDKFAGKGSIGRMQSIIAKLKLERNLHSIMEGDAFTGFVLDLTPVEAELLKAHEAVATIEEDQVANVLSVNLNDPEEEPLASSTQILPWGVQKTGYGDGAATGRTAWIIDSGIQLDHPDLNVDVARSRSFVAGSTSPADIFGHGTQIAGIIGAKDNGFGVVGVAAGATLVSVRILDANGVGTASSVISGLNYIAANAKPGDVVNFSMNFGNSVTVDNAVRAVAGKGIYVAIAAGNNYVNCIGWSPQKVMHTNTFTVSGLRPDGTFMGISNWGQPVKFCAPGTQITTTKMGGGYTATAGGTSMSAPHLAGILLMRGGANIPVQGYVVGDPDGIIDPIPSLD